MEASSPARLYALLVGGALTIAGIIGFFYDASFDTGSALTTDAVFGVLDVNGWHNVVHIVTGLLGLAAVGYAARTYALVLGVVYVVVAVWGFAETTSGFGVILEFLPVNTEDNILPPCSASPASRRALRPRGRHRNRSSPAASGSSPRRHGARETHA